MKSRPAMHLIVLIAGLAAIWSTLVARARPSPPSTKPAGNPTSRPTSNPATNPANAPELNAKVPDDFVVIKAGTTGVTLKAPKNWQEKQPNSINIKLSLSADTQGSALNLVVIPAAPRQTLDQTLRVVPLMLNRQLRGFKLIDADMVKLNGQPAARIGYEALGAGDVKTQTCQFFVLKNDNQYVLTFTARAELFPKLMPIAEQVAVSIQIP